MSVQTEAGSIAAARDLAGQVALVTGGASGIGRGIVEVLSAHGAAVCIADLDPSAARGVADATRAAHDTDARAYELDVRSAEQSRRVVGRILEDLGRIDILVNNAGVSKSLPFLDLDETEWDRVYDVNVKGLFLVTKAVLPHMIERGRGRVINLSSMAGKEALPLFVHYSSSKFAVIGITQGLAKEMAPHGITVNAVCPGVVRTPLWEPLLDQLSQTKGITREQAFAEFVEGIPLGRPQEPEDIGEVVAFLASEKARNMTGQGINVTGGMQLH